MSFWNKVQRIVSAPRKLTATFYKTIGEKMLKSDKEFIYVVGGGLKDFGDFIMPKCYKKTEATVKNIVDTTAVCKEYFDAVQGKFNEQFKELQKKEKEKIDEIKNLCQYFFGTAIEAFEEMRKAIPENPYDEEKEMFKNKLSEKISQNNEEFSKCLEIEDDKNRKEKCDEYVAQVSQEIFAELTQGMVKITEKVIEDMLHNAERFLDDLEEELKDKRRGYDAIREQKESCGTCDERICRGIVDISFLSCIESSIIQKNN